MKIKTIIWGVLALALCLSPLSLKAQRPTDKLDRGLVAVKTSNGVFTITYDEKFSEDGSAFFSLSVKDFRYW